MARDIFVKVIGDDLFSLNWMSLLLVRDWRTTVVESCDIQTFILEDAEEVLPKPDILLLDVDSTMLYPTLLTEATEKARSEYGVPLLLVSSSLDNRLLQNYDHAACQGLLMKDEISTSLAWAVTFAAEDKRVFTPTPISLLREQMDLQMEDLVVLKTRPIPGLTDRQAEIAKLAIVYSVGRRDLADELKISDQWSYGMVSELYDKLGIEELFSEKSDLGGYFDFDPIIKKRMEGILEEIGSSKKIRDIETLAFHLVTMPTIEESY